MKIGILRNVACFLAFLFGPAWGLDVALTFDDLPAAGSQHHTTTRLATAQEIVSTLNKHKMKDVFGFINGSLVKGMAERSEILALWKKNGFKFANHTYSHLDLGSSSAEDFIQDIEKNETVLIDFASDIPELKWFRYPFLQEGESTAKRYAIRSYLAKRQYRIAPVTIDFEDWKWNEPYLRCSRLQNQKTIKDLDSSFLKEAKAQLEFSDRLAKKIYGAKRPYKHILMLHFNYATSINLDRLLTEFEQRGVHWITLPEAMTDSGNNEDTVFVGSVGKTHLVQGAESRKLSISDLSPSKAPDAWLQSLCL